MYITTLLTIVKIKASPRSSSIDEWRNTYIYIYCPGFNSWLRKIPWRREQLPIPVFWPGDAHGQRNLVGYGP